MSIKGAEKYGYMIIVLADSFSQHMNSIVQMLCDYEYDFKYDFVKL